MLRPLSCRRLRRQLAPASGFTLVELMVSMTGGLFLTLALFALSRNTSHLYQREARTANATLAAVTGFERLTNDIARAGHMSTPNIADDPRVCNRPNDTWPLGIRRLRAVSLTTDGASAANTEVADAGIQPHSITISGALDTTEELYTNSIQQVANGVSISINRDTPAAMRLGLSINAGAAAANLIVMQRVFMSGNDGRIVRLRKDGSEQYGVVSGVTTTATDATVTLASNPGLVFRAVGAVQCGIDGHGSSFSLSVINIVRYRIRSMTGVAAYLPLFAASDPGAASYPFEQRRAELSRIEVSPANVEIPTTEELVTEYAVDLRFVPWAATNATNPDILTNAVATTYTDQAGATQLLRGLHVRFSVRSREADRKLVDLGDANQPAALPGFRMPLTANGVTGAYYATMRTFQSDIPLRNLENANW